MTIRKKSLMGTLRPAAEMEREVERRSRATAQPTEPQPVKQSVTNEDLALSKRTVSRILLAKSLFGR